MMNQGLRPLRVNSESVKLVGWLYFERVMCVWHHKNIVPPQLGRQPHDRLPNCKAKDSNIITLCCLASAGGEKPGGNSQSQWDSLVYRIGNFKTKIVGKGVVCFSFICPHSHTLHGWWLSRGKLPVLSRTQGKWPASLPLFYNFFRPVQKNWFRIGFFNLLYFYYIPLCKFSRLTPYQ